MPFKDILVHVDGGKHIEARLEAAFALATTHTAHVVGLFVRSTPYVPQFIKAQFGPEVIEIQRRYVAEAVEAAEKRFVHHATLAGVPYEWRVVDGDVVDQVNLHARYADLTVIGQPDPETQEANDHREVADHLILDAGRPVLVVPYAGRFPTLGVRVMVAWNGSREATRAVNDAIPLLQLAKHVEVMAINPRGGLNGHGDVPGADITLHLARHDVKAQADHLHAEDMDVGNMLLSRISDGEIDLLVMGAYGRSRLRELVMGGATRHILRHMTVPVMMSH
ncbi:MAG: universal stress protein [Alphaproteobacteria bacterium]|nr:universal stress protein [Alphaproteobacteria bacterium]MBF0333508.1 universal stress protein [Alphaproteobacteria bacterium]